MYRSLIFSLLLTVSLAGCARHAKPDFQPDPALSAAPVTPWTTATLGQAPESFRFAILADLTNSERPGIFNDAVAKVNLLQPDFVMSVGDLIEGYTEDSKIIDSQMNHFAERQAGLDTPFFHVPGNHDLEAKAGREAWTKRIGAPYYHFLYKDVLFLVLDSIEGREPGKAPAAEGNNYGISPKQVDYVAKALAQHPQARWTLVFMHVPLWRNDHGAGEPGWSEVEKLLADRPYTVFAGHWHQYSKDTRHGRDYYIASTTGGSNSLAGPQLGEFDGVLWVTFREEGPRVLPLDLKGMYADDVSTAKSLELLEKSQIDCLPALAAGDRFTGGVASITVRNGTDAPLCLSVKPQENKLLQAQLQSPCTVAPHSTRTLTAQIASRVALPAEFVPALPATLTARFEPADGKPVEFPLHNTIPLTDSALPCPKRARPVVLDGKLDEWGALPYRVDSQDQVQDYGAWQGPADCSYRFAVEYDKAYVYVAARVRDEKFFVGKVMGLGQLAYDHLTMVFDLHPESPAHFENRKPADGRLSVWARATDKAEEGPFLPVDVKEFKAVFVKDAQGYVLEAALPAAYLDQQSGGKPWEKFQFNLLYRDTDEDSGAYSELAWRATSSHVGANYLPQSTFVRKP